MQLGTALGAVGTGTSLLLPTVWREVTEARQTCAPGIAAALRAHPGNEGGCLAPEDGHPAQKGADGGRPHSPVVSLGSGVAHAPRPVCVSPANCT